MDTSSPAIHLDGHQPTILVDPCMVAVRQGWHLPWPCLPLHLPVFAHCPFVPDMWGRLLSLIYSDTTGTTRHYVLKYGIFFDLANSLASEGKYDETKNQFLNAIYC